MDTIPVIQADRPPTFLDLENHGFELGLDWSGRAIQPKARVLFWMDGTRFHFLAGQTGAAAHSHPESKPSSYHSHLWEFDVSEFFLRSPDGQKYLEFNLAPNGAWWSCGFAEPRRVLPGEPSEIPEVIAHSEQGDDFWLSHASIPTIWLEKNYEFGPYARLNATLILNSPTQVFLTAARLSSTEPDFHRPHEFPSVEFTSLSRDFTSASE